MKFGINLQNRGWASPESITALGIRADELGYDSVWVSDHVVIPSRIESPYPYGPPGSFNPDSVENYFESIATLSYLAGKTRRVDLGISVLVVPQRQPLVAAKQWATLDALSGGRTILGVGAGWMREEFAALGAPTFERRGAALDEAIKIFRAVWSQPGDISFSGQVYQFDPIRFTPKPIRPGGVPIWVGGHGRRSLRRAAELGDGWQGVRINLAELREALTALRQLLASNGRSSEALALSATLVVYGPGQQPPSQPTDFDIFGPPEQMAERIRPYQQLGIEHVVVQTYTRDSLSQALDTMEFFASDVRPLIT